MQLPELLKRLQAEYPFATNQAELSYSDEYALLETEQQKLTSLYGEKPDYAVIIHNAEILLQKGSGHFFIATALAHAMLQQYQWQGFIEGINFIHQRLQKVSDSERLKARIQSMNWLIERWEHYAKTHPLNGLGKDFLTRARESLNALAESCTQHFGDQINVMGLMRPFEEQEKRVKLEEDTRAANQKLEEERKAAQLQELQQTLVQNTETDLVEVDEHLELLKDNPFEPALYKYSRALMWWRYPLSSQELLSLIDEQGLDWQAYTEALRLKTLQNYSDALLAFEALAHAHPYFLDLQFHLCECLEELQAGESLLALLKSECQALCLRYPELESAKIKGEWPVCNKQIKIYFDLFQVS